MNINRRGVSTNRAVLDSLSTGKRLFTRVAVPRCCRL